MSYWLGRQYIGIGPGEVRGQWNNKIALVYYMKVFVCASGAHGRFVVPGFGDGVREARTQTLEPDVWIHEVQQRGQGTRRRITLDHCEL